MRVGPISRLTSGDCPPALRSPRPGPRAPASAQASTSSRPVAKARRSSRYCRSRAPGLAADGLVGRAIVATLWGSPVSIGGRLLGARERTQRTAAQPICAISASSLTSANRRRQPPSVSWKASASDLHRAIDGTTRISRSGPTRRFVRSPGPPRYLHVMSFGSRSSATPMPARLDPHDGGPFSPEP